MKNYLLIAALLTAACTSCTDQEEALGDGCTQLQVTASLGKNSRSIVDGPEFTQPKQTIGISLFDQASGEAYEGQTLGYTNVPYVSEIFTDMGGGK